MTQTPAPTLRSELIELARTILVALAIAVLLRIVLVQPFTIPSSSMEPGLVTGDYILVSKWAYGWSRASAPHDPPLSHGRLFGRDPERGDVVVFRRPSDPQIPWIKRVIGLPGDRVRVVGGTVSVNGSPLSRTALRIVRDHDSPNVDVAEVRERDAAGRSYLTYDRGEGRPGDDIAAFTVPSGRYFVMGDNRDNSLDGRFPADVGVGLLPAENLIGRAEFVVASWTPGASLVKPWTWLNLQWDRFARRIR